MDSFSARSEFRAALLGADASELRSPDLAASGDQNGRVLLPVASSDSLQIAIARLRELRLLQGFGGAISIYGTFPLQAIIRRAKGILFDSLAGDACFPTALRYIRCPPTAADLEWLRDPPQLTAKQLARVCRECCGALPWLDGQLHKCDRLDGWCLAEELAPAVAAALVLGMPTVRLTSDQLGVASPGDLHALKADIRRWFWPAPADLLELAAACAERPSVRGVRILMADDRPDHDLEGMRRWLIQRGYFCDFSADYDQTLLAAEQGEYDALCCDLTWEPQGGDAGGNILRRALRARLSDVLDQPWRLRAVCSGRREVLSASQLERLGATHCFSRSLGAETGDGGALLGQILHGLICREWTEG
jgi:hypothetical protein